eukprot:6184271-Pleurochrysis_carterae.AAC.5
MNFAAMMTDGSELQRWLTRTSACAAALFALLFPAACAAAPPSAHSRAPKSFQLKNAWSVELVRAGSSAIERMSASRLNMNAR